MFDTQMEGLFMKFFFEKVNFEKKISRRQKKYEQIPRGQRVNTFSSIFLSKSKARSLRNFTGRAVLYARALGTPLVTKKTTGR